MKSFAVAVLMLLASANAVPTISQRELKQERLITDTIISLIEGLSQTIIDAGLDPIDIAEETWSYSLPDDILDATASIVNLQCSGLSNIAVNSMSFSILTYRLTFDISMPRLACSADAITAEAKSFDVTASGAISGSIAVVQPRVSGVVRVSIGIISGISVRELSIAFSLEDIQSALSIQVNESDYSDTVNTVLGETIPNFLDENSAVINELIESAAWAIIERIL